MFDRKKILMFILTLAVSANAAGDHSNKITYDPKVSEFIKKNKNESLDIKIKRTHWFVNNKFKYKEDWDTYNKSDYWATPNEFVKNQGGDCEDYAIMKYALLKKLGVNEKDMKLIYSFVKAKVNGKYQKVGHVTLEVLNSKKESLILDNRRYIVVPKELVFKDNEFNKLLTEEDLKRKMKTGKIPQLS